MKLFRLLILCLFPMVVASQESSTGNWMMYFGNQKLGDRWTWHNEIQYRNYNLAGDLEQLLLRTGIGYNLSANNNNLLLGYAYIHGEPYVAGTDEKSKVNEHRIFQQFISRQQFGRFYLQHRYRIEERFIEEDFKMRFRYFLGLNIPITKKEMVNKALYLSLYNEIFIQPKSPVFDRDRVYGAIGYVFSSHLKAEAGYMAQLLASGNRTQFQIALFNTFPIIKS